MYRTSSLNKVLDLTYQQTYESRRDKKWERLK